MYDITGSIVKHTFNTAAYLYRIEGRPQLLHAPCSSTRTYRRREPALHAHGARVTPSRSPCRWAGYIYCYYIVLGAIACMREHEP